MAVKTPDQNAWLDLSNDRSVLKRTWTGANALANGDSSQPIGLPEYADRSWQVDGTPGAGGTIIVEGSNNGGSTWWQKNDLSGGNAWSKTAVPGGDGVAEVTELERVRVTGGDGTTAFAVSVVIRRSNPRGH